MYKFPSEFMCDTGADSDKDDEHGMAGTEWDMVVRKVGRKISIELSTGNLVYRFGEAPAHREREGEDDFRRLRG